MNDRTNYSGHYSGQPGAPRPQGIVFRKNGNARFSPYMWLAYADYESGLIKLNFGHYDVVVRSPLDYSTALAIAFEEITRHELNEISEKEGSLSIEIIEKDEAAAAA